MSRPGTMFTFVTWSIPMKRPRPHLSERLHHRPDFPTLPPTTLWHPVPLCVPSPTHPRHHRAVPVLAARSSRSTSALDDDPEPPSSNTIPLQENADAHRETPHTRQTPASAPQPRDDVEPHKHPARTRTGPRRPPIVRSTPPPSSSSSDSETQKFAPPEVLSRIVSDALQTDHASPAPDDAPASRAPPAPLPVQLDLLAYHARVAARNHNPKQAELLFRRAIRTNPADARAYLGLARLLAAAGNLQEARRIFRVGIRINRRNPFLLQALGVLEERAQNLQRAKALFEAAVRADPAHCASWVALGLWEQKYARDPYAARSCFRKGADADPRNYYVWHVWGLLEQSLGNVDEARRCFETGVQAKPENAPTYVAWGVLESKRGNGKLARSLFLRAQKENPRNAHALVAHAVLAARSGRSQEARELLQKAVRIRPRDAAIFQTWGVLEAGAGRIHAARVKFQEGLNVNPKHGPIYLAWGVLEQSVGHMGQARELFQQGVWANPKSPHVVRIWHAWARLEHTEGRVDVARNLFNHGLSSDPKSVAVLSGWALLEAENDNMIFARDMLEQAVRLQPSHKDLWNLYAQLETQYGTNLRASKIEQRAALYARQQDSRLVVAEALPGDFAATGMWIDPADVTDSMLVGFYVPLVSENTAGLSSIRDTSNIPEDITSPEPAQSLSPSIDLPSPLGQDSPPVTSRPETGEIVQPLPKLSPRPVLRPPRSISSGPFGNLGRLDYAAAFSWSDSGLTP